MTKTIKTGDKVETQSGKIGVVIARYREPLGHYWLYDVQVTESGKVITTRYVKHV